MSRCQTGCTGKIRHHNKAGACIALKRMKNAQMSAYPCRHCKGWHIGRSLHWAKINARLDQLIGKPNESSDRANETTMSYSLDATRRALMGLTPPPTPAKETPSSGSARRLVRCSTPLCGAAAAWGGENPHSWSGYERKCDTCYHRNGYHLKPHMKRLADTSNRNKILIA